MLKVITCVEPCPGLLGNVMQLSVMDFWPQLNIKIASDIIFYAWDELTPRYE
jgi:hypothetical protein